MGSGITHLHPCRCHRRHRIPSLYKDETRSSLPPSCTWARVGSSLCHFFSSSEVASRADGRSSRSMWQETGQLFILCIGELEAKVATAVEPCRTMSLTLYPWVLVPVASATADPEVGSRNSMSARYPAPNLSWR